MQEAHESCDLEKEKDSSENEKNIEEDQEKEQDSSDILSVDLKNIIKQELANI